MKVRSLRAASRGVISVRSATGSVTRVERVRVREAEVDDLKEVLDLQAGLEVF